MLFFFFFSCLPVEKRISSFLIVIYFTHVYSVWCVGIYTKTCIEWVFCGPTKIFWTASQHQTMSSNGNKILSNLSWLLLSLYIKNKTDYPFFQLKTKPIKLQIDIIQSDALVFRIHPRIRMQNDSRIPAMDKNKNKNAFTVINLVFRRTIIFLLELWGRKHTQLLLDIQIDP